MFLPGGKEAGEPMYEEEYDEMDAESLALHSYEDDDEDFDEAKEYLRGYLGMGEA